jgi:hypothetical protein
MNPQNVRRTKKKCFFAVFLIAAAGAAFGQSRNDVRIYIPPVIGNPAQADFFRENFTMETSAAGYTVTQDVHEADYSMRLIVRPNTIVYDDGTEEPAPPGEHQYILLINLIRNSDNVEVVSLSFGFTELEEMYHHNLSLLYQTMANVPLARTTGEDTLAVISGERKEDDRWRNKWLYLRASFDYITSIYWIVSDDDKDFRAGGAAYLNDQSNQHYAIEPRFRPMPGATIGLELQFLNWMSLEANFHMWFGDVIDYRAFIPGIGVQLKFPVKPSSYFMLEPYLAGAASMDIAVGDHIKQFPTFSAGAGIQLGVKGGNMGGFFLDVIGLWPFGEVHTINPYAPALPEPQTLRWNHFVIGVSVGYKIGFFNRR